MAYDLADYVEVKDRLAAFRKEHAEWGLHTEVVFDDGKRILMRAWITDVEGRTLAVGHAEEVRGTNNINARNAVENCETSAWGRAFAGLGYSVSKSIASREEMERGKNVSPIHPKVPQEAVDRHPSALPGDRQIARAAREAGFDENTRKDALYALVGVYSGKGLEPDVVRQALEGFKRVQAGEIALAYDPDGVPVMVEQAAMR